LKYRSEFGNIKLHTPLVHSAQLYIRGVRSLDFFHFYSAPVL